MAPDPCPSKDAGDGYTFTYDASEADQPVMAIVEAVAWAKGTDVLELTPLHETVDTDVLIQQLDPPEEEEFYRSSALSSPASRSVAFEYEGYTVTVTPTRVRIEEEGPR